MALCFDGRIAVITGGAGGLGRAYSALPGSRGAAVVVVDLGTDVAGYRRVDRARQGSCGRASLLDRPHGDAVAAAARLLSIAELLLFVLPTRRSNIAFRPCSKALRTTRSTLPGRHHRGMGRLIENTLAAALAADGPDPRYAERLLTFGRFVGAWDVEVTDYHEDGSAETLRAEWLFGWALGGRAVQDVWICPPRAEQERLGVPAREWGTAIRYYEPESDSWRMAWSGPRRDRQIVFVGRDEGERIVLEGEEDGAPLRWIFSQIRRDGFHWEAVTRMADGSWRRVQEMDVRRRASDS